MEVDRRLGDGQLIRDLLVAVPIANEPEYFQFAHGKVVFVHENLPIQGSGEIGPDGRYKLDAPVGSCRVAIQSRQVPPPDLPKEKQNPGYYLGLKSEIPDKYEDHMHNGLKFDVQNGNNTADWPLK